MMRLALFILALLELALIILGVFTFLSPARCGGSLMQPSDVCTSLTTSGITSSNDIHQQLLQNQQTGALETIVGVVGLLLTGGFVLRARRKKAALRRASPERKARPAQPAPGRSPAPKNALAAEKKRK